MKILFLGTSDFSATVFKSLHAHHPISAVVTGLDKQVGRGHNTVFSPLKQAAIDCAVPVYQFDRVSKDGISQISALQPDLIITAAFGQILSEQFLSIPKYGVLNVHASLLPKYRGASPIQWAILNGDKETGITIMKTVKAVDAGDVLLIKRTPILDGETAGELFDRLAILGGQAIIEAVDLILSGAAQYTPQDNDKATHCGMISKADGAIDFSMNFARLDCFIRAMTPWPSAYTALNGKTLKVFKAIEAPNFDISAAALGEVIAADCNNGLVVRCGDSAVRLTQIQLEGGKRMSDVDFLRGRKIEVGTRL